MATEAGNGNLARWHKGPAQGRWDATGGMMGAQGSSVVVLWSVLSLALAALVVALLARNRHHSSGPRQVHDDTSPALQEARDALRLRYARGEISREEYLQGKVELED